MKISLRFIAAALILAFYVPASAQSIVCLTETDQLFTIPNAAVPGSTTTPVAITGVTAGQSIVGMDYRPNTGELFAMGYNYANGATQLYRINSTTAVATAVNTTPITLQLGFGSIGFDFNPTVDRIRVVGATSKKNYRLSPLNGSIAATDLDLMYAPGDVNSGKDPSIGAVAYTNSFVGSEATTLYDYDESLNILALQNPPNNGVLNTVGSSGIAINTNNRSVDMDIYTDPMTKLNRAFLTANTGPGSADGLFSINLATGAATLIGAIGLPVKDIAVVIDRTIPATSGQIIYGLTRTNRNLVSFSSNTPDRIRTFTAITGLTAGQTLVGLDFRPADNSLYGLGYNTTSRQYQIYRVNTDSGRLTAVNGTTDTMILGTNTDMIGFDFNPTVDRIRVVSGTTRMSYRLNPVTGAIAAVDSMLNWAPGDTNATKSISIGSVAYTNSFRGATTTQLFGYNDSNSAFVLINPPNNGTLNTVFNIGFPIGTDLSSDMDFYYDSVTKTNIGYFAVNPPGSSNDQLYSFTTAGLFSLVNSIGFGIPIVDIAVRPTFTNAPTAGIGQPNAVAQQLIVYPNPAANVLHVRLPAIVGEGAGYEVRDITGRLLLQGSLTNGSKQADVSLHRLAGGAYFLSVTGAGSNYAPVRFIRQ